MKYESTNASEAATGNALRAVERQKRTLPMMLNADAKAQRIALFQLLEISRGELFGLVASASERGQREVRVTQVPVLGQRLPIIFHNTDGHDFDANMFNDWLFAKDVSHHFHSDGVFLRW